jgi:thiamine-phosphate pyrophosphorylase
MPWEQARAFLGGNAIIGGTINFPADAERARKMACLDYAGVGPLRFTGTKKKLAPVLGLGGVSELIDQLGDLPAYVIGGVREEDLAGVRAAGAAGAAVCAGLLEYGALEDNYRRLAAEWLSE